MSVKVQAVDEPGPLGLMNRDPNLTAVLSLRLGSLVTSRSKLAPSGFVPVDWYSDFSTLYLGREWDVVRIRAIL
jgi:hypothetical protein